MSKIIKGWKNTSKDLKCRNLQFEVGKDYHQDGKIELCGNGFHFHESSLDIFKYYDREKSIVVEIEASGKIKTGDNKSVCSDIKIIRILQDDEVKKICNLVNNIGLHNSGDRNSGDRNSGDQNSGDRNSGYWNSSSMNNGFFNSKQIETIMVFNRPCKIKQWQEAEKPNFIYFDLTIWVDENNMTDHEKIHNPKFYTAQGYLKTLSYKDAWKQSWDNKSDNDLKLLEKLPNFSWKVFTQITGINKSK